MTKTAIIRCEKNQNRCPLTSCFKALSSRTQGFAAYDETELVGIFTCTCPGDNLSDLVRILAKKGAITVHFCTCCFSSREEGKKWKLGDGLCERLDAIMDRTFRETGVTLVKGTAHLPEGYEPKVFKS